MNQRVRSILEAFDYTFLPAEAKAIGRMFYLTAERLVDTAPRSALEDGLRKLLELRDVMVDATVAELD